MIKARFGEGLDDRIQRIFPFLFRRSIDPNLLSVCGVLVSLGAAAALAGGSFVLAGLLMLAGGGFDLVDGVVARHQDRASRWGAFLDSTLDRLVDMALLLGALMFYARAQQFSLAWVAGLALVATVMVSYTKARAESIVPDFHGGILERAERVLILAAGALFGLMPLALWIVAIGSTITAWQRMVLAHRRISELDALR